MPTIDKTTFFEQLIKRFPHQPSNGQLEVLGSLSQFVLATGQEGIFLLKGYAGTGKTTLIGSLVKSLWNARYKSVLLAPTGRAAKVITAYSGRKAFTIHKKIYHPKKETSGAVKFILSKNTHRDTVFLVDEASMIPDTPSDSKLFENGSLLNDLVHYVYSGHNCKLVLIGDVAQLPPVKLDISPALNVMNLESGYGKSVVHHELDEVMRQEKDSGILFNATQIRRNLDQVSHQGFKFQVEGFTDIIRLVQGYEVQEAIEDAYANYGKEGAAIIVRSNKRANLFNSQIRQRLLFLENQLSAGDFLMVVKNNYFWLDPKSDAGFIANGDTIKVLEIFSIKDLYGFTFADVKVQMVDYPDQKPFETVLILDTLMADSPSLSYEDGNRLYQEVKKDYEHLKSNYKKFLGVKNNRYFNALQVKFSYAITCHKSQGGQWPIVFVEQPFLPNGIDRDYLRWLYTAVTRAKSKLYLLGFGNDFFVEH